MGSNLSPGAIVLICLLVLVGFSGFLLGLRLVFKVIRRRPSDPNADQNLEAGPENSNDDIEASSSNEAGAYENSNLEPLAATSEPPQYDYYS